MVDSGKLLQQLSTLNVPRYPTVTGSMHGITAASLVNFLAMCAWAVVLLIAFTGWGRLTVRLLRLKNVPATVACALGISLICFLGGLLNLLHAIVLPAILAIVAAGLILYAGLSIHHREHVWREVWGSTSLQARFLLLLGFVVTLVRASAGVRLNTFDFYDDGPGYLAMVPAMLAHHFFFTGPFSDRHIISSLGGGYWLQCFVVAVTSLTHIGMADRTLGFLLIFFTLLDLGIVFGLRPMQIAWIELLASIVPQLWVNLTFVVLPIALLLSLLWLVYRSLQDESEAAWRWAFLAGIIGGATVTLKSTFLPCVGTFCLFPYLFDQPTNRKRVWSLSLVAGVGALFVVIAWMIGMKLEGGTYLYPIFGHGLDYSSYGLFHSFVIPRTIRTTVKLFLQAISLFILAFLAWRIAGKRILFPVSVLIAVALGITAFNIATGGDWVWRYGFPQYFSAVLIFSIMLIVAVENQPDLRRRRLGAGLAYFALVACLFYNDVSGKRPQPFREYKIEAPIYWGDLQASLTGRKLASASIQAEYRAMQNALGRNGIVLENLAYPFLLNQKARTIYLMDWPGAASPAPGWPFTANTAPLVQYLQKNSVRYVLYDYRFAGWVDINSCSTLYHPQSYSKELYVLFWMSLLVHNQFDDLRRTYRSVYDDGSIAAIDLDQPIPNSTPSGDVWTPDTSRAAICTQIVQQYFSGPLPKDPE